jgi:hypothetical protein
LDGLVHIAFTSAKPKAALPEPPPSSNEPRFSISWVDDEPSIKQERGVESEEEEIVSYFSRS